MKYKSIYFLAVVLCLSNNIIAQTRQLKFNLITGSNGISLGKINAITQDRHGFMWFSDQTSKAIVRYDGNHMTQYMNDPDDPNTLAGYYPECLLADSSGVIWIGFNGTGVDRFDPVLGTFTHFRHDPNDAESLSSDFVNALLVDHLGNLWVGTSSGLDRLDQKTGQFNHFNHDANDPTSLSHDMVRAIYEDREGTVWIGTGVPWVPDNEGGLNRFDRTTRTFTRYMHDPNDMNSLASNKVRSILEDSKGNFWIGTAKDGLHTLDRKTGTIKRYPYDPKHPEKLSRPPENVEIGYDHITFIIEDAEEKLWIGTPANGINRYDPATQKITHFGNDADKSGTFKDNSGWCAQATSDGLVWLGTQEDHLFKIDLFNVNIPHFESESRVNSFCEEASSVFWMGTDRGLMIKDLENGTSRWFVHEPLNPNSLSNNFVRKVVKDHLGVLWIGTSIGLNRYEADNSTFTRFLHDPTDTTSLSESTISTIYEDIDSNLWVGTEAGGLNLLDRNTGKFTRYQKDDKNPSSIGNDHVTAIVEDKTNNLWIGLSFNAGVNRLNKKTGKFKQYLSGQIVNDLYVDAGGMLWAGTVNGLYRYDKKADDFFPLSGESTGIQINSYVMAIMGDDEGNLWVSTLNGIYKLNKTRDHLIRFGKENGVIITDADRLVVGSGYKASDGKLFFCDRNGYYSFYPNQLKTLPGESKLYFTSFWLNNRAIKPGTTSLLQQSLDDTQQIQLDHHQNVFAFSFTTINFRSSEDKIMSYTLENYDADWHQTGMGEKVNYFKVPPGKYIFRIKALNSATGTSLGKSIDVIISPPWWTTWWAYTIYGTMFIGGIFYVDRSQRKRLLEKAKAEAKEKELAQAKEIKKAYDELGVAHTNLKATQSQLIQSEKMASLGELTAGIAHEIQNPLNFVNNFSEVNTELIDELKKELAGGNKKSAEELADDIKQNELKINYHGKRAGGIVKDMLQHSRSSSGVKEPIDINALADEYLRLAYHGLRAKDKSFNATMKTDFDPGIGKVNVIPQDIGRVILNLITNAFDAVTEQRKSQPDNYEPTISVSTKKSDNKVLISVKDNGNGIPQKVLDKIFQPFFTTKPAGQGTGLGLSLSYDIVKAHGGELKVETKEAEGSQFFIQLPIL